MVVGMPFPLTLRFTGFVETAVIGVLILRGGRPSGQPSDANSSLGRSFGVTFDARYRVCHPESDHRKSRGWTYLVGGALTNWIKVAAAQEPQAVQAYADANIMSHVVGTEDLLKASFQSTDLATYKSTTAGAIIATAEDARHHTYEATLPLGEQIDELREVEKVQNEKLALLYSEKKGQGDKIAELEARIADLETKVAQLLVSTYTRSCPDITMC